MHDDASSSLWSVRAPSLPRWLSRLRCSFCPNNASQLKSLRSFVLKPPLRSKYLGFTDDWWREQMETFTIIQDFPGRATESSNTNVFSVLRLNPPLINSYICIIFSIPVRSYWCWLTIEWTWTWRRDCNWKHSGRKWMYILYMYIYMNRYLYINVLNRNCSEFTAWAEQN